MRLKIKRSVIGSMFWQAFITSSVIELAAVGSGLIDGIVISKMLGEASMAAEGIVHPFFSIAGVISGLLAVGMQSLCSSSLARGQVKDMQNTFTVVSVVALVLSVVMSVVLFACSGSVAWLLGARGNAAGLHAEAAAYLKGLSIGVVPMVLCVVFSSAISLENGTKLVQVAALMGSAADIALDVLAAGTGMGMLGVGAATGISYIVNFVLLLPHFLRKDCIVKLTLRELPWRKLKDVAVLGSEKATKRFVNTLRPIALNAIIISAGGALGMSALAIRNNVGNFIEIPITGIAGAVTVLTAICYGEKNKEDCMETAHLAHRYAGIYSMVVSVLLALFAGKLARFYVSEQNTELLQLVRFSFYCLAVSSFFRTLVLCRTSYLQSVRKLKKAHLLTFCSKLAVIVACAFVCVKIWGSYGVIVSFTLCDIFISIGVYLFYMVKRRKMVPSAEDYLDLPPEFDYKPQDIIELTVDNAEEASLVAEQIQLFCRGHKLDPNKGYKAALCMEEMTVNVLEHGYKKSAAHAPVSLRVFIDKDDVIIRLRDNCAHFNIKERISVLEQGDVCNNIGIKLVAKTSKDIKYVSLLNTNTVIITI